MKPIVITAGHSNSDPGATNGVITEAHIVTDFRNLVAFYLRQANVNFATDGTGHDNWPLNDAIKLAKFSSVAVEFHCNAFSNPTATGVETLSGDKDYGACRKLTAVVADTLGIVNRGVKAENSGQHSRLGFVQAGGIILELFFISNPEDLRRYLDRKWVLAKAVSQALVAIAADAHA